MAYEFTRDLSAFTLGIPGRHIWDGGSLTGYLLDSNLTDSAGDAVGVRFVCPVTTGGSGTVTVYWYCTATAATAGDVNVQIQGATDGDTPDGTSIGTVGSAVTPVASSWTSLNAITSCNLTQGNTYFLMIHNVDGTPGTNTSTMAMRGLRDGGVIQYEYNRFISLSTAAGYNTDWTTNNYMAGGLVIVFNDGTNDYIMGNPWTEAPSSAANTDIRGLRVRFPVDTVVSGLQGVLNAAVDWTALIVKDDATVLTASSDAVAEDLYTFRWTPYTLEADADYEIVVQPATNTNVNIALTPGSGAPANVKACKPPNWGFVRASTVAGLSASLDTDSIALIELMIDNWEAAAANDNLVSAGGIILTN